MFQYLIKWWGYPESDNTWEPADQVYAPDFLQGYHKHWPLESIKGKQKPLAKATIHTITSSKSPTIASQWPSLQPHYQSSSQATLNMSQSLSLISLSTPPHTLTLYPPTRSPSPGPSTTSRPTPFGMGPSCLTWSRTSLLDTRTSCQPSYGHLSQVSPPPYNRERRSTIARLTTLENTLQMSMLSAALSNSIYVTLMENPCCAPMDLRTIMEDCPHLLSLAQMGRVLLSSSSSWMMDKWQDLVPWQEASMMLVSSTYTLHWPSMTGPSSPSPTGSMPASGVTTLTSICFRRQSLPSTTGASSWRSNDTGSWTKRLPCYRQSLAWWTQTLQHLSLPRRPARTVLLPCEWQRRLTQWGSSISNCR